MEKERVFEHLKFNSSISAGYVARDIVASAERGSATAEKIVTVLNGIHKTEKISSLNRITNEIIDRYSDYLKTAYDNKDLKAHSVQGYIAALNAITNYINLRTDKDLKEISAYKDLSVKNTLQYGGKSTPQALYDKVYSKLSEANQIKQELQRNLGLRVRESHFLKAETIREGLISGVLKLNSGHNDGTKNSRAREVKIWTSEQRNTLVRALNYMTAQSQKSMITNGKTYNYENSKYYRDMEKAGGTRKNNNGNNFNHGNRHFNMEDKAYNILPAVGITDVNDKDKIISSEAGHGELRTTDIYLGKH